MNDLLPILKQFGIGVTISIMIAYFLLRHWWPYWKAKDERREQDRTKQVERMQTLVEVGTKEMTESLRANTRQSEKVSDHLEELTDEIRELRSK